MSEQNVPLASDQSERKDRFRESVKDLPDIYKYKMDYPEKGLCLIMNMENFEKKEPRPGTNKDADSLKKIFETIGFKVQIEKDKTCSEIFEILETAAEEDHSHRSCFVCVVMSHGDENGIYGYDDYFKEERMLKLFNGENCPKLAGKPKLFFFQVCRGDKRDSGVTLHAGSARNTTSKIPTEADFLCHYSTPRGYVSWRSHEKGSWFIQSLCEMLDQYWKKYELVQILTLVNWKVASAYVTSDNKNGEKQIPCIVSKLTKYIYL